MEGDVDPVRDMGIIFEELRLKDEDYISKNVEQLERLALRGNDKSKKFEYVCIMCLLNVYNYFAF